MRKSRAALLGAAASLALGGGVGATYAQSRNSAQGRVIHVPPGAVVIVLPGGAMPMAPFSAASMIPTAPMMLAGPALSAPFPFAAMPDAAAMMRQANQMLNQMLEAAHGGSLGGFAHPAWIGPGQTVEAATRGTRQLGGAVRGVFVTSFSDGHGTCTQRVIYGGNGAAPKVEVSSTGNACASEAVPMAAPGVQVRPQRAVPRTWQVDYRTRFPARPIPLRVAQLGN